MVRKNDHSHLVKPVPTEYGVVKNEVIHDVEEHHISIWLNLNCHPYCSQKSYKSLVESVKGGFTFIDVVQDPHHLGCMLEEDVDPKLVVHQDTTDHHIGDLNFDN